MNNCNCKVFIKLKEYDGAFYFLKSKISEDEDHIKHIDFRFNEYATFVIYTTPKPFVYNHTMTRVHYDLIVSNHDSTELKIAKIEDIYCPDCNELYITSSQIEDLTNLILCKIDADGLMKYMLKIGFTVRDE